MTGTAGICVVGLSHHTAPLPLREKVVLPVDEYGSLLSRIVGHDGVTEGVVLSTCNRTELVAVVDPARTAHDVPAFRERLEAQAGEPIDRFLFRFRSAAAVEHLFRVAGSLDSLVIGEAQVLGQVNEAFDAAARAGATGPILERLFARARRAAKRIRTETGIGELHVSVASVAVELADKIFGRLAGRSALVVGAGETARLTMRHLSKAGIRRAYVTNRTGERADSLSRDIGGLPVDFDRRFEILTDVDVVVTATAADRPIFTRADIAQVLGRRRHRPIFFIDLAVPRDVEPAAAGLDNVFLYNIDDLGSVVERNQSERRREAGEAEAIVVEEAGRFLAWLETLETVPTVVALRERLLAIESAEAERLLGRLDHLDERDRAAIRAFGTGLVGKILHEPTIRLREARDPRETARLVEAARILFDLDREPRDVPGDDDEPESR